VTKETDANRFARVGQTFATDTGPLTGLAGVDLAIARHEFVAVLGPSGCGKSTLLRLGAGLMTASAVEVFGKPFTRPCGDVGIVFQQPTLLPWASVLDNVVFAARHMRGRVGTADRDHANQIIETIGLKGFETRLREKLSGGMQQRVGIARALCLDPDILLMDEPFSALDVLTRDAMGHGLLRLWQASPKTVLFITRSIPEAALLADRILVMSERPGRIIGGRGPDRHRGSGHRRFAARGDHLHDRVLSAGRVDDHWTDGDAAGADRAVTQPARMRALLMHDPGLAPVLCGNPGMRHSLVAGRFVVRGGALSGCEMSDLRHCARRCPQSRHPAIGIGFVQLKNHVIPQTQVDAAFAQPADFFALPSETKAQYPRHPGTKPIAPKLAPRRCSAKITPCSTPLR